MVFDGEPSVGMSPLEKYILENVHDLDLCQHMTAKVSLVTKTR